jgi:hypothetical protein
MAHDVKPTLVDVTFLVGCGAVETLRTLRERFGPQVVHFTAAHGGIALENEDEAMLTYLVGADTPV